MIPLNVLNSKCAKFSFSLPFFALKWSALRFLSSRMFTLTPAFNNLSTIFSCPAETKFHKLNFEFLFNCLYVYLLPPLDAMLCGHIDLLDPCLLRSKLIILQHGHDLNNKDRIFKYLFCDSLKKIESKVGISVKSKFRVCSRIQCSLDLETIILSKKNYETESNFFEIIFYHIRLNHRKNSFAFARNQFSFDKIIIRLG